MEWCFEYLFLCPAGKNSQFAEGVVSPGPLSQPVEKTPPSPGNWTHTHAGRQLVQEPPPERSCCICKEQVSRKLDLFMLIKSAENSPYWVRIICYMSSIDVQQLHMSSRNKESRMEPDPHLSHFSFSPDYNRILPSCPQRTVLTAPTRNTATTPSCCLPPRATWAALRLVTVAQRLSAEERGRPPQISLLVATVSLSPEMMDSVLALVRLSQWHLNLSVTVDTLEVCSLDEATWGGCRADVTEEHYAKTTCT